jgi:hypothetical protein
MAYIKDYLIQLEELVAEAVEVGAQNEQDVIAYCNTHMRCADSDISDIYHRLFLSEISS